MPGLPGRSPGASPRKRRNASGLGPSANARAGSAEWPSMKTDDPYDLQRFVAAQDAGGTYERAAAELRRGRKTSHWMWFVFPQIAGLGFSPTSQNTRSPRWTRPGRTWGIRFSAHG